MTIQDLENASPGRGFYDLGDQLKRHVYTRSERAFAAGDAARDAIITRAALETRQRAVRDHLLDSIGGLPPVGAAPGARTVGTVAGDGFRVEQVLFESRPRDYVTANLYLPDGLRAPTGAVLFLCGHHREAKHAPEYQGVCQTLAHAGLIVLAQDPPGQGERLGYYEPGRPETADFWGTREHDHVGAQCLPLGDALARYFLHDAMRGVDYLCGRPEVDPARIGVTGNSGGGTQASLVMLADPRIAAAAPATFVMSRQSHLYAGGAQDAEQIWPGFTGAGFDHEDILLAMAPRPVRVLAVTGDFFPIEGTRRTVSRSRRFWDLCGADGLDLVEDDSTHAYTPKLARAAASFFRRHLLGAECMADEWQPSPFEPSRLWCTQSGQVRGELDGAASVCDVNKLGGFATAPLRQPRLRGRGIHPALDGLRPESRRPISQQAARYVPAVNQERLHERERERHALLPSARRERARDWLRARASQNRTPCDLNPRFYFQRSLDRLTVQMGLWWSQEGLFSHGALFRDPARDGQLPVSLALWDGGTGRLRRHEDWLRAVTADGRAVLVLDVSGAGALTPYAFTGGAPGDLYGAIHKLATDLLWLGDDLVSLRTYDVLRALDMIDQWPGLDGGNIKIYAHGRTGLYGRLAALLDERIGGTDVVDGLPSYADWISARGYDEQGIYDLVLPGVLRYFDLPEVEP